MWQQEYVWQAYICLYVNEQTGEKVMSQGKPTLCVQLFQIGAELSDYARTNVIHITNGYSRKQAEQAADLWLQENAEGLGYFFEVYVD